MIISVFVILVNDGHVLHTIVTRNDLDVYDDQMIPGDKYERKLWKIISVWK